MLENKINGKIYIGLTTRPIQKRFKQHQTGENIRCRAIYNAIQKYGWGNFEKDWYECPDEDLNFDEELLVREMGALVPNGYNLKEGGGSRGKMSDETKRKMSESQRGKTLSECTKQKIGEGNRGKTVSEETKQKMRKPKSEEHKQKMSKAIRGEKNHWFGKTHTEETKRQMGEARRGEKNYKSKKVYQYSLDGTFIDTFVCVEEAVRHLKKAGSSIRACARGKLKTAHGFKWSYNPPSELFNL